MNQEEIIQLRRQVAYCRAQRDLARRQFEHTGGEGLERAQERLDQAQAKLEKSAEDLYVALDKTAEYYRMRFNMAASRAHEAPEQYKPKGRNSTMDPRTTLEGQTVQTISEIYFNSLNDRTTNKLHLIQESKATPEEIQTDTRLWYAGFTSCAKLLGINTTQLPMVDSLLQTVTRTFPDKARIAA